MTPLMKQAAEAAATGNHGGTLGSESMGEDDSVELGILQMCVDEGAGAGFEVGRGIRATVHVVSPAPSRAAVRPARSNHRVGTDTSCRQLRVGRCLEAVGARQPAHQPIN